MAKNSYSQSWLSVWVALRVSGSSCSLSKRGFHWRPEQLPLTGCAPSSLCSRGYDSVKGGNMLFLPLPSQRPVHLRLSSFGGEIAPTAVVICSSPRVWFVCVFFFFYTVTETSLSVGWLQWEGTQIIHLSLPKTVEHLAVPWPSRSPSHLLADRGKSTNNWLWNGSYQIFWVSPNSWVCSSHRALL